MYINGHSYIFFWIVFSNKIFVYIRTHLPTNLPTYRTDRHTLDTKKIRRRQDVRRRRRQQRCMDVVCSGSKVLVHM